MNPKDYYAKAVEWAVEKKITSGTSPDTFSPKDTCTRGQIVTFLWKAAGGPSPGNAHNSFNDVADGKYYYTAVLWAVENGITAGISENSFGPNMGCTRSQAVTFLWRYAGKPYAGGQHSFKDVNDAAFYHGAVLWALQNGITAGTSAVTFEPEAECTRAQIVTFLYRMMSEGM